MLEGNIIKRDLKPDPQSLRKHLGGLFVPDCWGRITKGTLQFRGSTRKT